MNADEKTILEDLREELIEANEQLETARKAMGLDRYSPELLSETVWKARERTKNLEGDKKDLEERFEDFRKAAQKSLNAIRDKIDPMNPECPHSDLVAVAGLDLAIDLEKDELEAVEGTEELKETKDG